MSNLDKVMSKLKSQKSANKTDEVPEIEEPKKKGKKKVEEVPEVEEDEDDEEEEVEEGESEETEKEEDQIKDPTKLQEKRAEEIQILQNDGVFRVEMLYQLTQINQNLKDLNTLIAGVIENVK